MLSMAATIAAGVPQALAQGTGLRQRTNGLFGGGSSDASRRQRLDLTLFSSEAYDRDMVLGASTAIGPSAPEATGYSTTLVGAADYAWQGRRVQVRGTGSSALRSYRPLDNIGYSSFRSVSHTAGIGVSARLSKQATVLVNQTATYSPSYLYNLFPQVPSTTPGDAPPAALDYAMSGSESFFQGTTMTLTHDFTSRSSVSAIADYEKSDTFGGIAGRSALDSYGIRAHFSRRLTPNNTAAIAEYLYRSSEVGRNGGATTGETLAEHGVNIGVDYNRRLSARRRMTFGALIGATATTTKVPELAAPESALAEPAVSGTVERLTAGDQYYLRMSGQVMTGYEFGRMWRARAVYRRGVDYVAGLTQPVFADSLTASVDGLLTRRVDVLVSAAYSNGESALNRQSSTFDTYTGDVRLRYALTRTLAAYGEYLYYFWDSRGSLPLAPGIPAGVERNGARVGLMLSVLALRR